MMLAKSMHQIARIEFRNSKFPYARGLCPLATPARGLCPLEPPSLVNNLAPPFPEAGSAPEPEHAECQTIKPLKLQDGVEPAQLN